MIGVPEEEKKEGEAEKYSKIYWTRISPVWQKTELQINKQYKS